jgi:hypothetical protein
MLLLYVGVALSVIKFRLKGGKEYPAAFILPGGLFIPIITLLILAWFIFQSKSNEISAIGIFLSVLTVIYTLKLFFKKIFYNRNIYLKEDLLSSSQGTGK